MTRSVLAAVLALLVLAGCGPGGGLPASGEGPDGERVVRVLAASDLTFAVAELEPLVERRLPGVDVQVTFGASGQLTQQIVNGAPADLFLSADIAYPERLVAEGRAAADDVFGYAVVRLVLWVPDGSPIDPSAGLAVLRDTAVTRVALANPRHAPYGRAAEAALRAAGLLEPLRGKLVYGENVAQAADFVRTGHADAGLVALSLVVAGPARDVGTWAELPLDAYPRLDQGGVVLATGERRADALAVQAVLESDEGRAVFDRFGFRPATAAGDAATPTATPVAG